MATKEEVLERIAEYKGMLGEERVRRMGISDDWSDAMTMVVLLLKEPFCEWYKARLDNEEVREAVHQKVQFLIASLDKGCS